MFLDHSANLEWNLCCACDPGHMHQDWKIEHWEEEYVYTHIQVAHLPIRNFELLHCHQPAQVVFHAEVALDLEGVHLFLCASSVSADSLLCHFGQEGSSLSDLHEALPGVFPSQPSPFYGQETERNVHVELFQPYPTSFPCDSCRHVDNLQVISCWFEKWPLGITSTRYDCVASSKVFKACFVLSRGHSSAKRTFAS